MTERGLTCFPSPLPPPLLQGGLNFFEMNERNDVTLIYLNVKAKSPGLPIIENIVYLLSMYYVLSTFHAFLSLKIIDKISNY